MILGGPEHKGAEGAAGVGRLGLDREACGAGEGRDVLVVAAPLAAVVRDKGRGRVRVRAQERVSRTGVLQKQDAPVALDDSS